MTTQTKFEPVTKTMTVARGQAEAFAFFARRVNDWWPKHTHSLGQEKTARVDFEPKAGGRFFETQDDGTELQWGKVIVWDEPNKIVYSWHLSRPEDEATEVEVVFTALGDNETRVDLIHRNWEKLGKDAETVRAQYHGGWDKVFGECFGGFAKAG